MADPGEQPTDRDERPDQDTRAILDRRRFLIASAMAGAGLGAVVAGCSCEPQVCLTVVEPRPKPGSKPATGPPEPKPCLSPLPPKPKTAGQPKPDTRARACLSPPFPDPKPRTAAKPCLSVRPWEPRPRPCLSERLRDP